MQVFKLQDHTCNWKGPCALHESDWNLEILADADHNIFTSKFSPVVTVVIARSAISSTRNDGGVEIKSDTPTSKISNSVEGLAFSDDGQVRVEVIWVLNFVAIIRVFRKTIFWSGKSWGIWDSNSWMKPFWWCWRVKRFWVTILGPSWITTGLVLVSFVVVGYREI